MQRSAFLNNAQTATNNLELNKSLFWYDSSKTIKEMFWVSPRRMRKNRERLCPVIAVSHEIVYICCMPCVTDKRVNSRTLFYVDDLLMWSFLSRISINTSEKIGNCRLVRLEKQTRRLCAWYENLLYQSAKNIYIKSTYCIMFDDFIPLNACLFL